MAYQVLSETRAEVLCSAEMMTAMLTEYMQGLRGSKLQRCSAIFATRTFHFHLPGLEDESEEVFQLNVECPWRVEFDNRVVVGFEDYATPATYNLDTNWTPDSQSDSRQEEELSKWMGGTLVRGEIVSVSRELLVEAFNVDQLGGCVLSFSNQSRLVLFPTSGSDMEWMLRKKGDGYVAFWKGGLVCKSLRHG